MPYNARLLIVLFAPLFVISAAPTAAVAVDANPKVRPHKAPRVRGKVKGKRGPEKGKKKTIVGKLGVIDTFEPGTPLWAVRQAFRCTLDFDESTGFDCYVKINSEINKGTPFALRHLRRYQWKHFRKWAPTYVIAGGKFSFRVTRWQPKTYDGGTRDLRIYLHSRRRDNPAPIALRREGGVWKIYANSL